jgi:hypothetical protein
MYSLATIKKINNEAVKKAKASPTGPASAFNRLCSYNQLIDGSVILHSALRRSTGHLNKRRAKTFLAGWFGTNSATKRNELVESYF